MSRSNAGARKMTLILGVALVLLAAVAFFTSLPRGGKVARFVGTSGEGYIVVSMLVVFGTGLLLVVGGAAELVDVPLQRK